MSLIDLKSDPAPVHLSPSHDDSASGTMNAAFGNAAVDIEQLEKEIAAKESARREKNELAGQIGSSASSASNKASASSSSGISGGGGPRRMQEVSLETAEDLDTLDEPVWDTVKRDLKAVSAKFGQVLLPRADRQKLLRDWDLWGPLFICVALSLMLHSNGHGEAAPQFTQVFSLSFFGAVVVTVNIKMLGGTISFFQSLCVVGYCLLPPTAAAFVCSTLFFEKLFFIRLIITAVGFSWATYAAMGFLSGTVSEKRRMLVVYPIFLFYFIVSWLILSHS